jgi:glycosyltransferase involved in cell wall biosynthesis
VIPSAVDVGLFAPRDRVEARRVLGWDEDGPFVLLPGARSNRVKRADLFDAAVREAQLSVPHLTPVSLEGFSREDVVHVMSAVDLILMTSESEGSPVAIRESLACMTPVVSVDVGDAREILTSLPGCSIRSREPRDLAEGVLAALVAPRSSALRKRALCYDNRRIAERVIAVYESAKRNGASPIWLRRRH